MKHPPGRKAFLLTATFLLAAILAWILPGESPDPIWAGYGAGELLVAFLMTSCAVASFAYGFFVRSRGARFRLTAVLLSISLCWAAMEVVTYSLDWGAPNPFYIPRNPESTSPDVRVRYRRPPHLFWRGKGPGDLGPGGPLALEVVFKTDSEGFRNHREVPRADMVFIGDSFTEAGNVNEEQTFVYQTGQLLKRKSANLGTAGYGPLEELAVLEAFAFNKKPKWIVWQLYEGNDLSDVMNYLYWEKLGGKTTATLSNEELWKRRYQRWQRTSPFVRLARLLNPAEKSYPIAAEGTFTREDNTRIPMRFLILPNKQTDPAFNPIRWEKVQDAIIRGHELCEKQGVRLLVVLIPIKLRVMGEFVTFPQSNREIPKLPVNSRLAERLSAVCQARSIEFLNPTAELRSEAKKGKPVYFAYDSHLAPQGHQALARIIAERIQTLETSSGENDKEEP